MKKTLLVAFCLSLCMCLSLGIFASEDDTYGYYDTNHNGKVEFYEAFEMLRSILNDENTNFNLLRVMRTLKASVSSETVAATITSLDTATLTAKISTEHFEKITVPLALFGLDENANPDDFCGVPATIAVQAPASTFAQRYDGTANGIYAAEANLVFTDKPANADRNILSMNELNKDIVNGSHASDDINATTLALSYRDTVVLSSQETTYTRYNRAYYPRVKKINDNLYLLLFMYTQTGQHLYYATSSDSINWNAPEVMWNSANYIINAENSERYFAMNADAAVLDDGTILCVYAVRDEKNYRTNPDGCGLAMIRGTVDENNEITWTAPVGIYTGQVWEPSVLVRSDGQIHVYFTQVAPGIVEFGFDEDHRTTETGLIVSNDNGDTWTPDIKPSNTNFYRATTVYREFVGNKDGRPHYSGQMPVAVELANGKIFMTVEIKNLNGSFRISAATSGENGTWKELAVNEEGTYTKLTSNPNSSPYVSRFPSGEVYLTHNYGGKLVGKIGTADASKFGEAFYNAPNCSGIWGACELVGSHKMATVMQNKVEVTNEDETTSEKNEIHLYYHYLNHRITAKKVAVIVDGYRNDWALNTEALFVGSTSQAQAALQVAHDKDNMYFLINRLDYLLNTADVSSVYIAAGANSYYRIDVTGAKKAYTVYFAENGKAETEVASGTTVYTVTSGTLNIDGNTDKGLLTEISVPKSVLGLAGAKNAKMAVGITNIDGKEIATDVMADLATTVNWPTVILED